MGEPVKVLVTDLTEPTAAPAAALAAPSADTQTILAGLLADVMHIDEVPVHSHFFTDLGADSLVMAHFCARVRKRDDLRSVSMKDVYSHPSIASLATALTSAVPAQAGQATAPGQAAPNQAGEPAAPAEKATHVTTAQYLTCGALQLLCFVACAYLAAVVVGWGADWVSAPSGLTDIYVRAVLLGGAAFTAVCVLPVIAKWALIGRWTERQIRIWSLDYFRFWIVKTLIRSSLVGLMFSGSPLYALYLRALGVRIGRGTVIWSRHVPVCTDLLTIGAGTVIRKNAFFQCYRAHAGWIQVGPVTLGRDTFVGERAVLDINTALGDQAQLGHSSALHPGQVIPAGQRWHGSPAEPGAVDYLAVPAARCGWLRKARYCALTLALVFLVYLPMAEAGVYLVLNLALRLFPGLPTLSTLVNSDVGTPVSAGLYDAVVLASLIVFFGGMLMLLACAASVPRLLNRFLTPGKVYPLYGFHDRLHRIILRMTNLKFFNILFGDSSYIVWWVRWLGYRLGRVQQTGSNFGVDFAHEIPFLTEIGTGTMIADGLSVAHADYSGSSFRLSAASIGPHNFLGNNVVYPPGGRTGGNCLLATKTMIPLDGPVREGVGLLGSPPFEIPRSVERDSRFDHLRTGEEFRRRLRAKNRYNLRTMALYLVHRLLNISALALCVTAALAFYDTDADVLTAALLAAAALVTVALYVLFERAVLGFRRLQPTFCSIYDPYFWRVERMWKFAAGTYLHMFDGTPFRSLLLRALGARIGRRVFDDGCDIPDRTLVTVGDDCVLNAGSGIQCHSQEDGTYKSDRTTLRAGCTLGVGALAHYGVTMGEGAVLAADSFLMKGEDLPPGARFGGNPAREM
jgi:non-ribosomal peptide synthetase-like protein